MKGQSMTVSSSPYPPTLWDIIIWTLTARIPASECQTGCSQKSSTPLPANLWTRHAEYNNTNEFEISSFFINTQHFYSKETEE